MKTKGIRFVVFLQVLPWILPTLPAALSGASAHAAELRTLAGGTVSPGPLALAHGGASTPPELADGPRAAAEAAMARLNAGATSLEAALDGTVLMEDDPRFNAGTGARIRLDGRTIQMDASLMDSSGRLAAIAVIERVKNPILVAHMLLETPHLMLAGEGATRFAHRAGFPDVVPISERAQERYDRLVERLKGKEGKEGYEWFDWRRYWNFPEEIPVELRASDTVGTVTRDRNGTFAVTLSTGGTEFTLSGRVGDVPIFGSGAYAGPAGAVACTGHGESIIRKKLAMSVYEAIEGGKPAMEAVQEAVLDFPQGVSVGIIAIDRSGWGVASSTSMAYGMAGRE